MSALRADREQDQQDAPVREADVLSEREAGEDCGATE